MKIYSPPSKKIIGENIRKIRRSKGLTQKQLGELCGINESNIGKYERGEQDPKTQTLCKIAKALSVDVTDLYTGGKITDITTDIIKETDSNSDFVANRISEAIIQALYSNIDRTYTENLLTYFFQLNTEGKSTAVSRVEEMTHIEKYKKDLGRINFKSKNKKINMDKETEKTHNKEKD